MVHIWSGSGFRPAGRFPLQQYRHWAALNNWAEMDPVAQQWPRGCYNQNCSYNPSIFYSLHLFLLHFVFISTSTFPPQMRSVYRCLNSYFVPCRFVIIVLEFLLNILHSSLCTVPLLSSNSRPLSIWQSSSSTLFALIALCFYGVFSSSGSPFASTHTNPTCTLPQATSLCLHIYRNSSLSTHTFTVLYSTVVSSLSMIHAKKHLMKTV